MNTYYYSILLPVQTDLPEITYSSQSPVCPGARVIVSFNRRIMTGICHREVAKSSLQSGINYKDLLEILDSEPLLPATLMELAEWTSRYYQCPLGKAVFAMLPAVLQPEIASSVKWISTAEPELPYRPLAALLADGEYHPLTELRKANGVKAFYKTLENAEALGLISIKRSFDARVKPKTINYLKVIPPAVLPDLTTKQAAGWDLILRHGPEFPLQEVSDEVTYAIIKALVAKHLVEIVPHQVEFRELFQPVQRLRKDIALTPEQLDVIASIVSLSAKPTVHLLYGITGSGKTEVYIEVIRHYLQMDKNVILLIPEISLTPQMVDRFNTAFGSNIAILHSQLTERQRCEQWQSIRKGAARIVIGARSAIFAPLSKVGLIIVDEEHEPSYKQENSPRYQGRDLAIVRARLEGAAVILGSATPSLESWHNAETGKYHKHQLLSRPTPQGLPDVQLLDLRDEEENDLITATLREAIQNSLARREQVILLQNRRGYASFVQCHACGKLMQCPHCEISLYYHHDRDELLCHYCGYHLPLPRKCPACKGYTFSFGAPGTQKIEQLLKTYFPTAHILRLDSDSSRRKNTYSYMYDKMHSGEIDILLGTQMISKGLDFPNVTLVGVILADISLNVPDFRAGERTFNLLTQVAGRSGRGDQPGKVIIQTWNPDHYAIRLACRQDYLAFAKEELEYRRRLFYPPWYRLGRLLFCSSDEKSLKSVLNSFLPALDKLRRAHAETDLIILGPLAAPLSKINNLHRHHIIIKAKDAKTLSQVVGKLVSNLKLPSSISLAVDIDPLSLM